METDEKAFGNTKCVCIDGVQFNEVVSIECNGILCLTTARFNFQFEEFFFVYTHYYETNWIRFSVVFTSIIMTTKWVCMVYLVDTHGSLWWLFADKIGNTNLVYINWHRITSNDLTNFVCTTQMDSNGVYKKNFLYTFTNNKNLPKYMI